MECNMYGIPLYAPGERIRRLGEACEVIKLLWTEPRANFNGKYYQLRDALCEPKPVQKPYPPFVIGGSGEQLTLRVVAKYANIWNFAGGSVETFQHKNEVLNGYCKEIGRDPQTIQRSIQTRMNYNNLSESIEQMRPYIQEGASHIVLNLTAPYPENIVHRLVEEVVKPLNVEFQA
jgi:hypothetical protein